MARTNTYNVMEFYKNITQKHPLRYQHQFTVEFLGSSLGTIETGDFNTSDTSDIRNNITYWVQSSEIPSVDVSSVHVDFYSAGFEVPGVIKYPDSWTCEILIDQDLTQYNRLRSWQEAMSSYTKSGGGYKTIPNVIAKVNLLDSTMQYVVKSYVMEGVWINDLSNLEFAYKEGSTDILKCTCTFTMQYFYEINEDDPLGATTI